MQRHSAFAELHPIDLSQPALRTGLDRAVREIRAGLTVSDAFAEHALATEVGVRLLVVSKRSGELGTAMERIARLATRWHAG